MKCPHCGSTKATKQDIWKETELRDGKRVCRVRTLCECGQLYNHVILKDKPKDAKPKRQRRSTPVRKNDGEKAKGATA